MLSAVQAIDGAATEAFAVTSRLRIFAQEKEIEPRVVQVNEVLRRLESAWKNELPGLTVTLQPDARPVQADSRELTRALDLILQHVHHWMDARCGITIAAAEELEDFKNWFAIRIAYVSTGEDAPAIARAFDPSWDGNWEGLPLVYSLIKRMRGLISARMEGPGKVIFEVYLPSVKVAAAGQALGQAEKPVILLIEPNTESRRVLRFHFEQHGYNVLDAGDCDQALRLTESSELSIRLVLANPSKEDRRKAELVGTLLHNRPGIHLRIFDGYREEEHAKGQRPLTKWDLLDWVNGLLGTPAWALAAS
jgi:hypothetical protein